MSISKIKARLLYDDHIKSTVLLLGIYAFTCGINLPYASLVGMNTCEFVLYMITDHYYLIYAWLFYLFFITAKQTKCKSVIERIRYSTSLEYYYYCIAAAMIRLASIIVAHIFVSMAVGCTRLHISYIFEVSAASTIAGTSLEVLNDYAGQFNNPFLAIGAVVVWWMAGSTFFSAILLLSYELWNNKGLIACTCTILVSVMIGFITEIDEGPMGFLLFNNYYILHHALANKCMMEVLVVEAGLCMTLCSLGRGRLKSSVFRGVRSMNG